MKTTRMAGIAAMAAGLIVAGVAEAQPDPNMVFCEADWIDCDGVAQHREIWCPTLGGAQTCCRTTTKGYGPDGEPHTGDDCVIAVDFYCGAPGPLCKRTVWSVPS